MDSELLTMDAGPELDIAIAKLAGWQVHTITKRGNYSTFTRNGQELYAWLESDDAGHVPVPSYSTNFAAALKLLSSELEALSSEDYAINVSPTADLKTWACWIESLVVGVLPTQYAPSEALAVCRMWIAWKLQQKGGAE